jgi:hypothetical protein
MIVTIKLKDNMKLVKKITGRTIKTPIFKYNDDKILLRYK